LNDDDVWMMSSYTLILASRSGR